MVNDEVTSAGNDENSQPGERSLSALFSDNKKFELLSDSQANSLFRFFNYFGLIVPMLVVLTAMGYQVIEDDLPCSHCNMQRLGYFMLALGPALNLRFGFRPSHYGISLAGAFFLAELGDKTMLATVTLAADNNWFGVWLGSTVGMVAADALAIVVGQQLGTRLPERTVKIGAAATFVVFGVWMIVDGFR